MFGGRGPGLRDDGIRSNSLSTHHVVIGMDPGNVRIFPPTDAVAMYPLKEANLFGTFIAPKASAEGACILSKMGYCH